MGADFINFFQRHDIFSLIHTLADFQALPYRIREQRRGDFLSWERARCFKCSDQGAGCLFKGAACCTIHSFSNLSDAELMQ